MQRFDIAVPRTLTGGQLIFPFNKQQRVIGSNKERRVESKAGSSLCVTFILFQGHLIHPPGQQPHAPPDYSNRQCKPHIIFTYEYQK